MYSLSKLSVFNKFRGGRKVALTGLLLGGMAGVPGAAWAQQASGDKTLAPVVVTASRITNGIPGASTRIISAAEIADSPSRNLPELLQEVAGIQIRDLFGGTYGARATVDLRGFGATANSNTLILVDGQRLNDIDLAAVDFSRLPKESIERIEIIRGNVGAVLYGDGAVGGVINIITRGAGKKGFSGSVKFGTGSYYYNDGSLFLSQRSDTGSISVFAGLVDTKGYRDNNELHEQNLQLDARRLFDGGQLHAKFAYDKQRLGLPGARCVSPALDLVAINPRGATTPNDRAETEGFSLILGGRFQLNEKLAYAGDVSFRRKKQFARLVPAFGPALNSVVDTQLDTLTFNPRLQLDLVRNKMEISGILGIDSSYSDYASKRKRNPSDTAIHRYDGAQWALAPYGQITISPIRALEIGFGARLQHMRFKARDRFNVAAPGASGFDAQQPAIAASETEWAANLGLNYGFNQYLSAFARTARSFRLPNMDERIKPFTGSPMSLETQTSWDLEAGLRLNFKGGMAQLSAYNMELRNEIHFNPATFANLNFDPTRRQGIEFEVRSQPHKKLKVGGAIAYQRARFRKGPFAGNEVPLVSPLTLSANAVLTLNDYLYVSTVANYYAAKRMDNDERNFQPKMESYTPVDVKVGGKYKALAWSVAVNNLFDESYMSYAVASATTPNVYNGYPMPGRTLMFRLGVNF